LKPSQVLTYYYALTFLLGTVLTVAVAFGVNAGEISPGGAAIMSLSWNVLFIMILPLVLDWSERKHCQARFLELEDIQGSNPELAAVIAEQCRHLSIAGLRLAVVDKGSDELFSYGLWGYNPRLILPQKLLTSQPPAAVWPSIEAELTRFASQDHTMIFLLFTVLQITLELVLVWLL
jgi:hypothetical protein